MVEVSIGVEGSDRLHTILERARPEGLLTNNERVELVGIRWRFTAIEGRQKGLGSKLYLLSRLISTAIYLVTLFPDCPFFSKFAILLYYLGLSYIEVTFHLK